MINKGFMGSIWLPVFTGNMKLFLETKDSGFSIYPR